MELSGEPQRKLPSETAWHLVQGTPAFFRCTRMLHNALQGEPATLIAEEMAIYEEVLIESLMRLHLEDCDVVIVHDPQPWPAPSNEMLGHFQ